jgi:hypothetical protein
MRGIVNFGVLNYSALQSGLDLETSAFDTNIEFYIRRLASVATNMPIQGPRPVKDEVKGHNG